MALLLIEFIRHRHSPSSTRLSTATPEAIFPPTGHHAFNMPTYKIIATCIERAIERVLLCFRQRNVRA